MFSAGWTATRVLLIESHIHFHQGYALCPKNTAIKTSSAAAKKLAGQIKLMEELTKKLAERDYMEVELLERTPGRKASKRTPRVEIREVRM
jgi:hypothetical protein